MTNGETESAALDSRSVCDERFGLRTLRECQKRNEKHKRKRGTRSWNQWEGIVLAKRGLGKKRITWRRDTKKFGTGEEQGWAYWVLSQEGGVL